MRVFLGCLATETNSFSPLPCGWAAFEEMMARGEDVYEHPSFLGILAQSVRRDVSAVGGVVVPGLFTFAEPAGTTRQDVYEGLRDELIAGVVAARADVVLLFLHGAMIAEDEWDCEGDILERVRNAIGPDIPVGVVMDPHGHLTPRMIDNATVIVFMKEYPHTDGGPRFKECLEICLSVRDKAVHPVAAVHDCQTIALWPTTQQPVRGLVDAMMAAEDRNGILSISFVHGFPWGDTPVTGGQILVYADKDIEHARSVADEFGLRVRAIRGDTMDALTIPQAVARCAGHDPASAGPIILADMSDNPGCGSPGDATYLLRAFVEAGLDHVAIGAIYDPQAVLFCQQIGTGGRGILRIGGKTCQQSGMPVDLEVEVRALCAAGQQSGIVPGQRVPMGDTAWIHASGIDIIMSSIRCQVFHPDAFTHLGLDIRNHRAVAVKSVNHFRSNFEAIAADILYVDTPGAARLDFSQIDYRRLTKPFWPRDQV